MDAQLRIHPTTHPSYILGCFFLESSNKHLILRITFGYYPLLMDNVWLGFSSGRSTGWFEAGLPCAVPMRPMRLLGFSVQRVFPEFSNFSTCSLISHL